MMDIIKSIFNASTYAALRNMLAAIGILLGMVGVVALSPAQIDKIIAIAQQVGTTLGAVMAFAGLMTPLVMGGIAAFKATDKSNVNRTATIATGEASPIAVEAQKALITATAAIAQDKTIPKSTEAKDTLVAATIGLDSVQTIVTDKETADASPSASVVAADSVTVKTK